MTTILLDPTLRRARIARATVAVLLLTTLAAAAVCALELRARDRPAPSLPTPRRPGRSIGRRPHYGQRPAAGQRQPLRRLSTPARDATTAATPFVPPKVTAFVDSSINGALESLRAHARQITNVAFTGLLLDDEGAVIDRMDRAAIQVAREQRIPTFVLLQNIDSHDARWRAERVRALARNAVARARLSNQVLRLCADQRLAGVHLDLEQLEEDWSALTPIAADLGRAMRAAGLKLVVDVPASLAPDLLAQVARHADQIVVMAYDEHDEDDAPGPIASEDFVSATLEAAGRAIPRDKLTAGLALYGYDWIGTDSADPISFVDAHTASKEAHTQPHWDQSGNVRAQYVDDEGHHEVWMTDAASLWNQTRIAAAAGLRSVALWRLGGEDPGVWDVLRGSDASALSLVAPDGRVDNQGDGPFLSLSLVPEAGQRELRVRGDHVDDEEWIRSPSPYLVRRAGIAPGRVALTFDDGPDPRFTPLILDLLKQEHVPATFFVIGTQALQSPQLVQRAFADGHEIGNHSFSHPNVDDVGDTRLRTELESTSQVIESFIGRRPLMYRPPSLADVEPRTAAGARAFARAGALGYLVVDADIDPRDWEQADPEILARKTITAAGNGGVILLHDGGGDRSPTLQALPRIIHELRQRGKEFVLLSELVGKQRDEVMPITRPKTRLGHALMRAVLGVSVRVAHLLRMIIWVTLVLVSLRALLIPLAAVVAARRGPDKLPQRPLPSVTALIPVFNEQAVVTRTIDSVLASDVPVDVIVVDDGSTDQTADLVLQRYLREPRVRLLRQANAGKAAALRTGFRACDSEAVVALDGDTLFARDTIRHLIGPLRDPKIGAVAGTAEVGNVENALGRWQAIEYMTQQELERRAWGLVSAVPVVPGAVGAWRRQAVLELGGFPSDTFAEDADMAMALCRRGWRVVHAPRARARTEAPATVRALLKQRVRWSFGILQALWRHRRALTGAGTGWFGRLVWPSMVVFQVLLPMMTPAALLGVVLAALGGNLTPAVVTAGLLFGVEVLQFAVAAALARTSGGSTLLKLTPSLLSSRVLYRPLLMAVMLRSLGRLLDGVPLGWEKLARRNTVVAYAAVTGRANGGRS